MFLAYIYSNGDVGSDEYFEKQGLMDFIDYELRIETIDECIHRLVYEKEYLKGLMNNDTL